MINIMNIINCLGDNMDNDDKNKMLDDFCLQMLLLVGAGVALVVIVCSFL